MRYIATCLIVMTIGSAVRAQDSLFTRPNTTKIERMGYVCGAVAVSSLYDYIVFSLVKRPNYVPPLYRVSEFVVNSALAYFLYKKCGLTSSISFGITLFTFGGDMAYYGWAYLLNPKRPFENRSWNGLTGDAINWASWTPIGLTRKRGEWIDKGVIIIQSMIGFSISIAIL